MDDSTTKSSAGREALDRDLDEQGRAMAAADEAAGDAMPLHYPADERILAAEAAELGPLPDGAAAVADEPGPVFGPRPPVTENQASMRYALGTRDAIERYSQLSLRHHLADAEAKLRARRVGRGEVR
jgi:hypothetical protein